MKPSFREEIKKRALLHNPKNVIFKDNPSSLILIAKDYSYHSSVFDHAFKFCNENGIKFKTECIHPYSIKFY